MSRDWILLTRPTTTTTKYSAVLRTDTATIYSAGVLDRSDGGVEPHYFHDGRLLGEFRVPSPALYYTTYRYLFMLLYPILVLLGILSRF